MDSVLAGIDDKKKVSPGVDEDLGGEQDAANRDEITEAQRLANKAMKQSIEEEEKKRKEKRKENGEKQGLM